MVLAGINIYTLISNNNNNNQNNNNQNNNKQGVQEANSMSDLDSMNNVAARRIFKRSMFKGAYNCSLQNTVCRVHSNLASLNTSSKDFVRKQHMEVLSKFVTLAILQNFTFNSIMMKQMFLAARTGHFYKSSHACNLIYAC